MADKQDQRLQSEAIGIQSGRDTNIGASSDDIRSIIETLGDQLPKFAAIASDIVDQRLRGFEEKIINRFESDHAANREAFKDPDFQYVIGSAQHAFARSGEEYTAESLSQLIVERSKAGTGSRLALTLNAAVQRVSQLTLEEFAELAAIFFVRRVRLVSPSSVEHVASFMSRHLEAVTDHISVGENSYLYLESLGCGKTSVINLDFESIFEQTYPGFFRARGSQITNDGLVSSKYIDAGLVIKSPINGRYQAALPTEDLFKNAVNDAGLEPELADGVWKAVTEAAYTSEETMKAICEKHPKLAEFRTKWNGSMMRRFEVSAVGSALGVSYLRSISKFDGDAAIWLS